MTNPKINLIREKCIAANPEIVELRFPGAELDCAEALRFSVSQELR